MPNAALGIVQDDATCSFTARFIAAPTALVTVASFRVAYPEFSNPIQYPESQVAYWLRFAFLLLNACVWEDLLELGAELYVAHNLTLEARAQAEAKNGAPPGFDVGMINNKSVDKVTVGYDTASSALPDAGHWNLTIYGLRFKQLVNIVGARPIHLGIGPSWPGGILPFTNASDAWPGFWFANQPNPSS